MLPKPFKFSSLLNHFHIIFIKHKLDTNQLAIPIIVEPIVVNVKEIAYLNRAQLLFGQHHGN